MNIVQHLQVIIFFFFFGGSGGGYNCIRLMHFKWGYYMVSKFFIFAFLKFPRILLNPKKTLFYPLNNSDHYKILIHRCSRFVNIDRTGPGLSNYRISGQTLIYRRSLSSSYIKQSSPSVSRKNTALLIQRVYQNTF